MSARVTEASNLPSRLTSSTGLLVSLRSGGRLRPRSKRQPARCAVLGALLVLLGGCGGAAVGAGTGQPVAPNGRPADRGGTAGLVPPGYGTLTQDEFTLELESGALQIKVTPLAESVIRLAAPDTYQRLAGLSTSASASLRSRARGEGSLFLVTIFSRAPTITYEPENLHIVNGGLRYRPTAIEAITPGWGGQRLRQEEPQIAVYAFDPSIDLEIALTVEYEGARDTSWEGILNRLELERARVRARIGS